MTIANVLTVANIILASVVVYSSLRTWAITRWFVDLIFGLAYLGWVALYVWVLFADPANYDPAWFGATFIRPLNTLTFGLVAATIWYRWRHVRR